MRGYVLAGGASRRFGADKASAQLGGRIMLRRMCQLVESVAGSALVVASSERYAEYAEAMVEDRWPGEGPLGGIITALYATAAADPIAEWSLMVSCDMPFLTRDWLEYLTANAKASQAEVVLPRSTYGLEPLCACWRTSPVTNLQPTSAKPARKVTHPIKPLPMATLN